ncbi:TniQ family protein [Dyella caseinilytica]|uniref:TniQ family protein n=1 Tax=Dyella caseinilytica TaxID=1849581 RepID=A0ABX7GZ70_9GAMM|nr:TniQ family protein [Dyella caseinilytica]QRN55589.1 TniQ family protein [Dyella caseinilytica]
MHARRWPLHPLPLEGEAITSWIVRIARQYGTEWDVLLHRTFGWPDTTYVDADTQIPHWVIRGLSAKTGVPASDIRLMTLAGQWDRLLTDTTVPTPKEYLSRYEILFSDETQKPHHYNGWQPWRPDRWILFACRECVAENGEGFYRLIWRLPMLRSCPIHGQLLERAVFSGEETRWVDGPQLATPAIRLMDALTWQGWTQGYVDLKRRRVSVAEWLCMLRCLIEETCFKHHERGWSDWFDETESIEIPFFPCDVFEHMEMREVKRVLEAVAYVLARIQHHQMRTSGKHAQILVPPASAWDRLEAAARFCHASSIDLD